MRDVVPRVRAALEALGMRPTAAAAMASGWLLERVVLRVKALNAKNRCMRACMRACTTEQARPGCLLLRACTRARVRCAGSNECPVLWTLGV